MKFLLEKSQNRGCYKTILDCTDDVKPFYEKLGFKQLQMKCDLITSRNILSLGAFFLLCLSKYKPNPITGADNPMKRSGT